METLALKKCPYCRHSWILRTAKPLRCPNCGRKLLGSQTKTAHEGEI